MEIYTSNPKDVVYVSHVQKLYGFHGPGIRVILYGTYRERDDWPRIKEQLHILSLPTHENY